MPAYAQDSSFFTRRGIVVVLIIGLHILAAWALASGLARKLIEVLAPPSEVDILEEVKQEDEQPPPPPPEMERPAFFFQAEDGIRDGRVTGVQTCALPI